MSEFKERNTEVVGVSTDSKFSHKAWMEVPRNKGGIADCAYPIIGDFTKKISCDYGVLEEGLGAAVRGTFVIDPKGVVQAIQINNLPIGRSVDEILRLLDAFQEHQKNGVVCPIGWAKGKEAIDPAKAAAWFQKNA